MYLYNDEAIKKVKFILRLSQYSTSRLQGLQPWQQATL